MPHRSLQAPHRSGTDAGGARFRLARHVGPVPARGEGGAPGPDDGADGSGLTVYDCHAQHYLRFNRTGALIVELLDDGETLDDTAAILAEVTDGDPDEVRTATAAFVTDLVARGLLVARP